MLAGIFLGHGLSLGALLRQRGHRDLAWIAVRTAPWAGLGQAGLQASGGLTEADEYVAMTSSAWWTRRRPS